MPYIYTMKHTKTHETYWVLGAWADNGDTFQAIIGEHDVFAPDLSEGDKALLCGITLEDALEDNELFTVLDSRLSTKINRKS